MKLLAAALAACLLPLAPGVEASYASGCSVRLDLGIGPIHVARAVAIQADGRIVVAGYVDFGSDKDFIVARFHPDLSLDTSFNGTGYITQNFDTHDDAYGVAIQTDGKIVVVGYAENSSATKRFMALVRYLPDGSLDPPFGAFMYDLLGSGNKFEELRAVALQPDGKIVAVGYHTGGDIQRLYVARFLADGNWDTSFNGDGDLTPAIGDTSMATGVTITPRGDIVVSATGTFGGDSNFIAVRIRPDGSLDPGFNGVGWVDTDIGALDDDASAVAVDQNDNVMIAGTSNADIAIVRYLPDGSLDGGFGTGGIKIHDIGTDAGRAVALDALGITIAGKGGPSAEFALTRFAPTTGVNNLSVTTDISGGDEAFALAIRKDGKLVLAGYSQGPGNNQLTLALYNSDGTQDCGEIALHPEADATLGFTSVGACASNWDCANDQPGNALVGLAAGNDGFTSVVTSGGPTVLDLYKLADGVLPGGKVVTEIEVVAQLAWSNTGASPSTELIYQRDGIDPAPIRSATLTVANTTFQEFRQRWSNLNWNAAELDALNIGLEHVAGNDLLLTQMYVSVTFGELQTHPVDAFTAGATGDGAGGQVTLNWLNPAYGQYDETVIRRDTAACPATPADGAAVVNQADGLGQAGSFVDLVPLGTTYYYAAFVEDAENHASTGECLKATPFDRTSKQVDWIYATSDPVVALATPGLRGTTGVAYTVTNDGLVHAITGGSGGSGGGSWPSGWKPFRLGAKAPNRPPVVLLPSGQWAALFGAEDGRVYAIDSATGALLWRSARLGPMISSSPAAMLTAFGGAQDLVFIGTRNASQPNQFYALNAGDGTVAWKFDPGPGPNSMGIVTSSPAVNYLNEQVYFTSFRGGSGNTLWCLDFFGPSLVKCSIAWPGFGVAISASDVDVSPVPFSGSLYVTDTPPGDLYAVEPMDGSAVLLQNLGGGGARGYVFPRFGTADVIASTATDVRSIDTIPPVGILNWVYVVNAPSAPLQVPGTNDIYVGSGDGKLHRLSTIAPGGPGSSECIGDCTSTVVGSPAYDHFRSMIYVGTIDGEVYGVKTPY